MALERADGDGSVMSPSETSFAFIVAYVVIAYLALRCQPPDQPG